MSETSTNERAKGSSSLPTITLLVLIGLIAALLYIGYDSLADDTGNAKELTSVPLDTTEESIAGQNNNPAMLLPDSDATPAPVDLSQAPAPPDEDVAENASGASTEEKDVAAADKTDSEEGKADEKPDKKPEAPKTGGSTATYTVGDGETFYGVANRLNMKVSTLKALNPGVDENSVKSGVTRLRVNVKTVHTVGAGDVLRVVAAKYGVSKEALMRANHKTKDIVTRGEKLIIPLPEK